MNDSKADQENPNKAAIPQPAPTPGSVDIWPLVLKDIDNMFADWDDIGGTVLNEVKKTIMARVEFGKEKYGTPLQSNNGRQWQWDALQEGADLPQYIKQGIIQSDNQADQVLLSLYRRSLKLLVDIQEYVLELEK